jgi:hypothetical protein
VGEAVHTHPHTKVAYTILSHPHQTVQLVTLPTQLAKQSEDEFPSRFRGALTWYLRAPNPRSNLPNKSAALMNKQRTRPVSFAGSQV